MCELSPQSAEETEAIGAIDGFMDKYFLTIVITVSVVAIPTLFYFNW